MSWLTNFATGLFSSGASAWNSYNNASKMMDFQKEMSNTAHQREVKDLRSAGLNPILSATGGSGASTTSGAMATTPDIGSTMNSASKLSIEDKNSLSNIKVNNTSANLNRSLEKKALNDSLNSAANTKYTTEQSNLYKKYQPLMYEQELANKLAQNEYTHSLAESARAQTAVSLATASKVNKESSILNRDVEIAKSKGGSKLPYAKYGISGLMAGAYDEVSSKVSGSKVKKFSNSLSNDIGFWYDKYSKPVSKYLKKWHN